MICLLQHVKKEKEIREQFQTEMELKEQELQDLLNQQKQVRLSMYLHARKFKTVNSLKSYHNTKLRMLIGY